MPSTAYSYIPQRFPQDTQHVSLLFNTRINRERSCHVRLPRCLRWRRRKLDCVRFSLSGLQSNTSISTVDWPRMSDQRTLSSDTQGAYFCFVRLATTGENVASKCLRWRLVLLRSRSGNNWRARKHVNQAPKHYLVLWVTVLKRLRYTISLFFSMVVSYVLADVLRE